MKHIVFSVVSTEADTGERIGHAERETEMDGGTGAGEPEKGGTDTSQTDGNTHTHILYEQMDLGIYYSLADSC